ncbi:acyl carrier protein [Burkholderia pyrrocinia]
MSSESDIDAAALAAAKTMLAGLLCLQEAMISPDQRLLDDLAMDSLEVIELAMELEEHWGVELDRDQLSSVLTVRDVAALLARSARDVG